MRSPDLLRLARFFVVIVEEGHFGHAADRLDISQPSLSQGLQRLERELGVTLLHRGPRSVELTAAGAALAPRIRRLVAVEDQVRQEAREQAASAGGLRLGVAAPVPAHVAAALAAACSAAAPGAVVALHTASTAAVLDSLAAGRLDHGVIVHPAVLGDLAAGDVVRLPTDLLLPHTAAPVAPATGASARLRDLLRRPLATPPREHAPAAHDLLLDTLHAHGVATGTQTVEDDRSALALVAVGQVCALTADPHLRAAGVVRRPVPGDVLPLRVRVVWKPSPSSGVRAEVAERLTAVLAAQAARTDPPEEDAP